MILALLLACAPDVETYHTTGDIHVLTAECVDDEARVSSQHDAAHLLGVEVCHGDVAAGCETAPVRRGGALLTVDCPASEYGEDAYIRARFLELAPLNPE